MRRIIVASVTVLAFVLVTAVGPAAQARGPKDPVVFGWGEMWSEEATAVTPGTWVLFSFPWGFAAEDEGATVPADYLDQLLDEGASLEITVDGRVLPIQSNVVEDYGEICSPSMTGEELCWDTSFVFWESQVRPLLPGSHDVTFRLEFLKDFPSDGWGFSVAAGEVWEEGTTIVVGL
jgi:hypothetical protein